MNSNAVNNAFASEAGLLAARLAPRLTGLGPVTGRVLVDRLVQRVLDLGRLPYAQLALSDRLSPGTVVDLRRCALETGTGRLVLTTRQWIQGVAEYLVHWAYCLFALLAVRAGAGQRDGVVLVFGVSADVAFQDGQDRVFAAYCRSCPIVPLREGRHLYVQTTATAPASSDPRITYVKRPLIELIRRGQLGWTGRMRAAFFHGLGLFEFLWTALRVPELALLGRDCAYGRVAVALDASHLLEAVVTTCSSITEQPLWGRCLNHAKVHMVWYAQNWKPVVFEADGVESNIPFLSWIRVDVHWVWTHKFAKYLSRLYSSNEIHSVGPVVWHRSELSKAPSETMNITVFDISPYSDEVALSYCEYPNYNHPHNLTQFILKILSVKKSVENKLNKKITIHLKTKRGYKPAYDRVYFDFIESLGRSGAIVLEEHSSNIYKLISSSNVIVAYPYTSPPYIADALKVPSVYFDPTGSIKAENFSDKNSRIEFACDERALEDVLIFILSPTSEVVNPI